MNIHYSSFANDIRRQEDFRIVYNRLQDQEPDLDGTIYTVPEGKDWSIYYDSMYRRVLFQIKIIDNLGRQRGIGVFYVSLQDLRQTLIQQGILELGKEFSLVPGRGYIINLPQAGVESLKEVFLTS